MQDALHEYGVIAYSIENSMAPMNLAANALAVFGPSLARLRMPSQQIEDFVHPANIGIGNFITEPVSAELADPRQIAPRHRAKLDFSHAANGARL